MGTVRHLLVLFALAGCATVEQPVVFKKAGVGAAATNPDYWDTPVEVCGHVLARDRGPEGEWMLTRTVGSATHWLLVDVRAGPLTPGADACVRGVVRRRDGLTHAQAEARGKGSGTVVHAANPDYVLRPCSDATSCRAAGMKASE